MYDTPAEGQQISVHIHCAYLSLKGRDVVWRPLYWYEDQSETKNCGRKVTAVLAVCG